MNSSISIYNLTLQTDELYTGSQSDATIVYSNITDSIETQDMSFNIKNRDNILIAEYIETILLNPYTNTTRIYSFIPPTSGTYIFDVSIACQPIIGSLNIF